jgi:Taurine catabolism dioxygenase TauD, TfdA family
MVPDMPTKTDELQHFNWQSLDDEKFYHIWRAARLNVAKNSRNRVPVRVADLQNPSESEVSELFDRCESENFAFYESPESDAMPPLGEFAAAFGLRVAETHRSADGSGIVSLRVTDKAAQRGYIPYSPRGMNWHTDGYYNAPDERISAFVLHCVRPAAEGGVNQLFDPEILYIRLRDQSPDHIRALMHPEAMTIPENRESDGTLRPASVGPVFFADPGTGRLQMRYTARTRSISWRDDPATTAANACLRDCLAADDPLMLRVALKAGQGILNNNILHDRTSFTDKPDTAGRLMIRVRFHNRVKRNA